MSYVVLYSTYLTRTACYCMTVAWHRQKPALAVVSCMRLFPTTLVNNASFRTWQSQTWASIHTQLGLKISSTAGRLFPPNDERIGRGDDWEPARSHWGEWLFTRLLTFLRLAGAPRRHVVSSNFPCLPSVPVYPSLEFPLLTSTTPLTSPESGDDAQGRDRHRKTAYVSERELGTRTDVVYNVWIAAFIKLYGLGGPIRSRSCVKV